jgi:RNA polymerase sigma-70 factor (ECF subfamily)
MLVAWEELEPAEVARVLGISKVAARSRLHRARRRLRAELSAKPETRPGHGNELECEEAR